jgi:hypothetical protein
VLPKKKRYNEHLILIRIHEHEPNCGWRWLTLFNTTKLNCRLHYFTKGRRSRDRMVVGFTTTYAISAYHHWCCEFESRSVQGVQHYVIKFLSDLRKVVVFSSSPPVSSINKADRHDITEILLKVALNIIKPILFYGLVDNWYNLYI